MITSLIISTLIIIAGIGIEGKNLVTKYKEVRCDNDQNIPCINPECNKNPNCEKPYIQPGEIIKNHELPDKKITRLINTSVWMIVIISLIINHLKENKKYKLKHLKKELQKTFKF